MSENQSDTPDTPPDVIAAQAKSRALTPQTAELIGSREYVDDAGHITSTTRAAHTGGGLAKKARERAEAYAGGEPVRGIPEARVAILRGKHYPEAPKMDPELGDRTPAFVNWLWSNKPADAKVRYAYRDIWPTSLPTVWPPKAPAAPAKRKKPVTQSITVTATG